MDDRIISIETRIALYEKTINELSLIVFEQGQTIGRLVQEIKQIKDLQNSAENSILKDLKDESPPPHY